MKDLSRCMTATDYSEKQYDTIWEIDWRCNKDSVRADEGKLVSMKYVSIMSSSEKKHYDKVVEELDNATLERLKAQFEDFGFKTNLES